MPNETNIRKVIDHIKIEDNYFNMADWNIEDPDEQSVYPKNVCGTPSCIGGWAESINRFEDKIPQSVEIRDDKVGDWLGLEYSQAVDLFYPCVPGGMGIITREQAVAHLEHIIVTGEVNWKKFVPAMRGDENGE